MLTTLAIAFVILLLGLILYGFGIVMRRIPTSSELQSERCLLCRQRFDKSVLIEREVGDTTIVYFCRTCIRRLAADAAAGYVKNETSA
ncbi:MAG: hypothetical protein HBSIN02_21740 [Bacteroidia bacterium]|nr:MAG: hypothetical protein HBSIN02_21740 [Bacteroidia bacterium]